MNGGITEISLLNLSFMYLLLILPLSVLIWYRTPLVGKTLIALVRMTLQLSFVGFYLQVVFEMNNTWLTALWLAIMLIVADSSIVKTCSLKLRRFLVPLFIALLTGTLVPLLFFIGVVLDSENLLEAKFAIPLTGMILGNCLRSNIIGVREFYQTLKKQEKEYHFELSRGATFSEAIRPYIRDALFAALSPTIATIGSIGLVSLPGMMTGVILGGASPVAAVKYQIAIMIAIFSGCALTVTIAILITAKKCFDPYGLLDKTIFKE